MKNLLFIPILLVSISCSQSFEPQAYPVYEYSEELPKDVALQYEDIAINMQDIFGKVPSAVENNQFIQFAQQLKVDSFLYNKEHEDTLILNPKDESNFYSLLARLGIDRTKIPHEFSEEAAIAYPSSNEHKALSIKNTSIVSLARFYTDYYFSLLDYGQLSIGRKIVWQLAKKDNMLAHEYIEKNINNIDLTVNDQELNHFLYKHNLAKDNLSSKQIEDFKNSLRRTKENERFNYFISKYLFQKPLKTSLKKPSFQFKQEPKEPFVIGDGNLVLSIYSSFNCQPCLRWNEQLLHFYNLHKEQLKIHYYPSFSKTDRTSKLFFEAALCMSEQKRNIFWSLIKDFNQLQDIAVIEKDLINYAEQNQLDVKQVKSCIVSRRHQATIEYYQNFSDYLMIKTYPLATMGDFVFGGIIDTKRLEHAMILTKQSQPTSLIDKIITWFKSLI